MIGFKGRLFFLQYLPKKPQKWGIKACVLADSSNGYTWNWKLYTGKEEGQGEMGLAERVVMELVNDGRLEGKGYIIVTDNFYSSPKLFRALVEKGFGTCGTTRRNRRGIPASVGQANLKKGEIVSSVDNGIMALK